jgi:hypothetical protein
MKKKAVVRTKAFADLPQHTLHASKLHRILEQTFLWPVAGTLPFEGIFQSLPLLKCSLSTSANKILPQRIKTIRFARLSKSCLCTILHKTCRI